MERQTEALKAFIGIKRTNDLFEQAVKKSISSFGLTINEFGVLELLYHRGEQSIKRIKERILIANSSTTYVIDRLCEKGLVSRTQDSEDKRMFNASLTEEGQKLIKSIFPQHAEMLEDLFDGLSVEEINQFREQLKRISKNIQTDLENENDKD